MSLTGHHAVVTGAGSGIGRATAERLAEAGCQVTLIGRHIGRLNETADRIGDLAFAAPADVIDPVSDMPYGRRLVGYSYVNDRHEEIAFFTPDEVAHYKPLADPRHPFRGAAWLTSVLADATADDEMTTYKHAFLSNAATPNLVVKFEPGVSEDAFKKFKERLESGHRGAHQGFKTLYLGAGADVKTIGSTLDQLNFKSVQGAGETRIAAAAGVPASILGISEGLAGSALNAGTYTAARRRRHSGPRRPNDAHAGRRRI